MRLAFIFRAVIAALLLALAGSAGAQEQPNRKFQECPECPMMVGVPAGHFLMGSPPGEPGRFDAEGPQHAVTLKAFALGQYDVTSAEFLAFLRDSGYQPKPCNPILGLTWHSPGKGLAYSPADDEPPRWPAVCLDWRDAQAYVAWLNAKVKALHPTLATRTGPYRLPSEAEWEYAARAATLTSRWWGDDLGKANANCNGCGSQWDNHLLAAVGSFAPNAFGLYDMLGNAWQWTADCWHPSYQGAPDNGRAWMEADCAKHVLRGGAWNNIPLFVRSAARTGGGGDYDYSALAGFRVARDLP